MRVAVSPVRPYVRDLFVALSNQSPSRSPSIRPQPPLLSSHTHSSAYRQSMHTAAFRCIGPALRLST